ncbi:hypothetical protein [Prosthecobacter sp.]|jgi:hypothetical protein|uniref:hypothetical protein n=1 Tax=Prosthecobacter sp. TaxID=1965333 RepID=UPI0037C859AF
MTSITDVLHHLVRRGLALRIETNGTLFIYDPRRYTRGADAEVGRHLPAKTQALSARAERRLLEEARHALTSAVAISTGAAASQPPFTTTMCYAGAGMRCTGGTRTVCTASTSAAKPAASASAAAVVSAPGAAVSSAQPAMNPGATTTTSTAARKVIVLPEQDRSFAPTGAQWRGITWLDVPGHDVHIKKLNFALLKRGKLDRYKECAGLHGAALRQRLQDISERNRDNGHKRAEEARLRRKSTQRPKPP